MIRRTVIAKDMTTNYLNELFTKIWQDAWSPETIIFEVATKRLEKCGIYLTETQVLKLHEQIANPSAILTKLFCNRVKQVTLVVIANALAQFIHRQDALRFDNGPFAMKPLGFNRIEPGTFAG